MPIPPVPVGRRARPLSPQARRAALIAATLPLLRQSGADLSTRQIAAAAGVAEGTIFRAFPDKESLIRASIEAAFDPAPAVAALERIDVDSSLLEERLVAGARIVRAWLTTLIELMTALRTTRRTADPPGAPRKRTPEALDAALGRLLEPDRDRLRIPPPQAARLLHLLLFSAVHPGLADGDPIATEQIVSVVLDGVRARARAPREQP